MKKQYFLFILFFLTSFFANAKHFEFTPLANEAYQKAMSLRFEEAKKDIEKIKREDPENQIVYFIENYIDFFTVFINENKSEFKRLEKNKHIGATQCRHGTWL